MLGCVHHTHTAHTETSGCAFAYAGLHRVWAFVAIAITNWAKQIHLWITLCAVRRIFDERAIFFWSFRYYSVVICNWTKAKNAYYKFVEMERAKKNIESRTQAATPATKLDQQISFIVSRSVPIHLCDSEWQWCIEAHGSGDGEFHMYFFLLSLNSIL